MDLLAFLYLLWRQLVRLAHAEASIEYNAKEIDGLFFDTNGFSSVKNVVRHWEVCLDLLLKGNNLEHGEHLLKVCHRVATEGIAISSQDLNDPLELCVVDVVRQSRHFIFFFS